MKRLFCALLTGLCLFSFAAAETPLTDELGLTTDAKPATSFTI